MSKKYSVLITGASGLLGRQLLIDAKKYDFIPIGIAFSRAKGELIKCDLMEVGAVEELIDELKPDVIVHAAAERFPDKVEQDFEKTKILNIDTSRRLSQKACEAGCNFIHISTDYVFDGTSPPYLTTATPNPLNKYGITKFESEKAVMEVNQKACILRIPILYGPVEYLGESAITCQLPILLNDDKPMSVSHYEKRYPSHVTDISNVICQMISKMQTGEQISGIFHWSGSEQLTKYEMVCLMGSALGRSHDHISADCEPSKGAARPKDSKLDRSRLEEMGIGQHTKFQEGIRECLLPWMQGVGV